MAHCVRACLDAKRVRLGLSDHVDHVLDPLARWPRALQEKAALIVKLDQVVAIFLPLSLPSAAASVRASSASGLSCKRCAH